MVRKRKYKKTNKKKSQQKRHRKKTSKLDSNNFQLLKTVIVRAGNNELFTVNFLKKKKEQEIQILKKNKVIITLSGDKLPYIYYPTSSKREVPYIITSNDVIRKLF